MTCNRLFQQTVGTRYMFRSPIGLALDKKTGDFYVSEFYGHVICKISPDGVRSIVAGKEG